MTTIALNIAFNMLLIAGGLLTLYGVYFGIVALFGFHRRHAAPAAPAATRFAVLVAARNEAAVIGNLVESLKAQNYPAELVDIFVAPNNCTDNTARVAAAHGARLFTPRGKITGKGQVLHQAGQMLMEAGRYDAVCVFDADNLVHPDFLQKMNDARQSGVQVAQGFRDSKNPADTAVSTCSSIWYWMVNRFYNAGRQALGLSALVHGCGYMVGMDLLRRVGGFNTRTMTEDFEFTAQCVLQNERVHYVEGAVFYDEQPLTFVQSWKQRRRWSTGSAQGMFYYLADLVRAACKRRSWLHIDLALAYMAPAVQAASLVVGAATAVMTAYQVVELHLIPGALALAMLGLMVGGAFMLCTLLAAFVVWLSRDARLRGTGRGIACFSFFLLTGVPISVISLFKPQKTWDAIAHTRSIGLGEVA